MARHLFVAVTPTAFGEVLQGRRVAEALVRAGDHVSFLAPAEVQGALAGAPVRRGVIEALGAAMLDDLVVQVGESFDTVCLVDLAAVALTFQRHGLDLRRLSHARLVALDLWSLAETDLVFDFGATRQPLPDGVLAIPRLVPVPFARPEAAGGYAAWPSNQPLAPEQRRAVRARLGLPDERVVVIPSAAWQAPERQVDPASRAAAIAVPPMLLDRAVRAGATVVHVGPHAWAPASAHYRHLPQLPPAEFADVIAAADAVVTANISATTIATALAAEVPVVVIGCAGGEIPPFAVWPLGLRDLLAPVLADNPLLACVRRVELHDEPGFAAALEPDPGWLARTRDYRARVAALPGPDARYRELTS